MKPNRQKFSTKSLLILLGFACAVLIIISWFYWFEWRPAEIRKFCYQEVKKEAKEAEKREEEGFWIISANKYYQTCLINYGLEIEPLFKSLRYYE